MPNLLTSGKLNVYITDVNKQAEDIFFRFVKQMAGRDGVTEKLKADRLEWMVSATEPRNRKSR